MDANYLAKKEKLYAAERAKIQVFGNESITSKELLDSYKAIEVAKADLEGKVVGFGGFQAFLNEFIKRKPTWFSEKQIEDVFELSSNDE